MRIYRLDKMLAVSVLDSLKNIYRIDFDKSELRLGIEYLLLSDN